MSLLNGLLAVAALILWGGVIGWYFWRDIKRAWAGRNDKWFRGN